MQICHWCSYWYMSGLYFRLYLRLMMRDIVFGLTILLRVSLTSVMVTLLVNWQVFVLIHCRIEHSASVSWGRANAVLLCPWSALCRPFSALLTTLCSPPDLSSGCLAAKAWEERSLESPLLTDQLSCEPYGWTHCLVETCKSLWQSYLHQKDFLIVSSVNFDTRLDEMDAGFSKSRHTSRHH